MTFKLIIKLSLALMFFALTNGSVAASLSDARNAYSTRSIKAVKAPQAYGTLTAPKGVREVTYQSGKLQLKAWITASNTEKKLVPAVVFLHGGFAFSQEDWDAAGSLVDAEYILMMPQLRGENGNPGNFEFFGGEVDDAIAAGRYLSAVPGIDKERIFLIGHSVGASLAILVAQMESPYKASAALSGYPRLLEWIDHYNQIAPYDVRNELERKIRNPYLYAESVRIPLYLFSESQNQYVKSANAEFCSMVSKASFCRHEIVSGDHISMISPSLSRVINIFRTAERESK